MVAHLKDPRVRALMETIRTELDPSIDAIFGAQMPAVAILRTRSGRTFEERVEKTKGKYPELPFTEEEFLYKIQTNAGHTLRREKIDELVAFVKEIEHSKNIGELAALVRG
jgi:2-methylcitrate dehydratase PrpD